MADYCSIFRCDVLKKPKKSLKSFNPLARSGGITKRKMKRILTEQQLHVLRTHCVSLINQCIPQNVHYDTRVKLQRKNFLFRNEKILLGV